MLSAVEKLHRRDKELASLLDFVRYAHPNKLGNYTGRNIDYIVRLLYDDDTRSWSSDNSSLLTVKRGSHAVNTDHVVEPDDEEESTHNLAHGLHFASIAMLGLLVLEVTFRSSVNSFVLICVICANNSHLSYHKLQITLHSP